MVESTNGVELKINSDPANLRRVRKQIEDFARSAGLPQQACHYVGLAANEALANIMRHGYGGAKDRPILVTARRYDGGVQLTIRDWAAPFDPGALPPGNQDPSTPGGIGLICIRKVMDEVHFSRLPDGTLLTMVKRAAR